MPRIRSIKPEFWTDGAIISLPFEARLFYIGMWNFACDRGHLSDDPLGLKLKILPADIVDGSVLLDTLVTAGRVERVTLPDGRGYLSIPRFNDHQRIDTRWNSRCGLCSHLDSPNLAETHVSLHKLTPGGEGKGEEGKGGGEPAPYCPKHPGGTDTPCGPCRTARLQFEAFLQAKKTEKPRVPEVRREKTCTIHAEYPLPCDRCKENM